RELTNTMDINGPSFYAVIGKMTNLTTLLLMGDSPPTLKFNHFNSWWLQGLRQFDTFLFSVNISLML
ncbi:hypothetical protein L9F63_018662, partial [Diploptera punctata]